jgi:hypothetical protein
MYPNRGVDPRSTSEGRALSLSILAGLYRGGAHLLLGTDTMKVGTLPGYSLHDALKYFVTAGLPSYEAIRAGTADAAKFLRQEHEFGRVATGLRADLLLVDTNPLSDVQNVSKIAASFLGVAGWRARKSSDNSWLCVHVTRRARSEERRLNDLIPPSQSAWLHRHRLQFYRMAVQRAPAAHAHAGAPDDRQGGAILTAE